MSVKQELLTLARDCDELAKQAYDEGDKGLARALLSVTHRIRFAADKLKECRETPHVIGKTVMNTISPGVYILSQQNLDAREQAAYARGVKRGMFEQRMMDGKERVAINCANWKEGRCDTCGAQWQQNEVSGDYKCPHFRTR